jgi:hypothetical protein
MEVELHSSNNINGIINGTSANKCCHKHKQEDLTSRELKRGNAESLEAAQMTFLRSLRAVATKLKHQGKLYA